MEHLFIINPAAGNRDRTQEFTAAIHAACDAREIPYRITVSEKPGDCARIAREAAETGKELHIYACGGDGTLNEVVSGVAGYPNVSITTYSGGSGNDFIRIFGDNEAFRDLNRLLDYDEAEFDLIDCNGNYALNVLSVGFDARIGTEVAAYKRLPGVSGSGAYLLSTLVNLIRGVSEHYVVEVDGETIDDDQTMVCVCNGRYYGGSFNPVPEADPCDGKLDVLLVKKISRLQVPAIIGKYKNGLYATLPKIVRHFRTDRVKIICDKETPVNLDGELRLAKTVEMKVSGQKVRFFYPKGLRFAPAVAGAK